FQPKSQIGVLRLTMIGTMQTD
ncbi:MAG: hypothetical protein H6R12_281, partial [Proteobacteria bacterium]|nr:hypothetical protein [Pseudomonadota bacterium]